MVRQWQWQSMPMPAIPCTNLGIQYLLLVCASHLQPASFVLFRHLESFLLHYYYCVVRAVVKVFKVASSTRRIHEANVLSLSSSSSPLCLCQSLNLSTMLRHPLFIFLTLFCLLTGDSTRAPASAYVPSGLSPFRHCFFCFSSCSLLSVPRYHPPRLPLSKQPKTDQLYPPAHWGQATLPFQCLASPLAPQGPWSLLHAIHPGKPARPARGKGLKFENHHHLPD